MNIENAKVKKLEISQSKINPEELSDILDNEISLNTLKGENTSIIFTDPILFTEYKPRRNNASYQDDIFGRNYEPNLKETYKTLEDQIKTPLNIKNKYLIVEQNKKGETNFYIMEHIEDAEGMLREDFSTVVKNTVKTKDCTYFVPRDNIPGEGILIPNPEQYLWARNLAKEYQNKKSE